MLVNFFNRDARLNPKEEDTVFFEVQTYFPEYDGKYECLCEKSSNGFLTKSITDVMLFRKWLYMSGEMIVNSRSSDGWGIDLVVFFSKTESGLTVVLFDGRQDLSLKQLT